MVMENSILRIILTLSCLAILLFAAVSCLFYTDETRRTFIRFRDYSGLKWGDPRTWYVFEPTNSVFRIVGVLLVLVAVFVGLALALGLIYP